MTDKEKDIITEFEGKQIPAEVQEILDYKYREEAKAKVRKAGLFFPARPNVPEELLDESGNISLPQDLTNVTDEELGLYLSIFTAISSYAEGVVAVTDIDWTTADRVATFAERLEIMRLPKEQQKNEDLRYGAINQHQYIRELRKKELQDLSTYKLSAGLLRAYEKSISALSREITRRANTFNYGQYEDNLSKRGRNGK
mgnify:FL=1